MRITQFIRRFAGVGEGESRRGAVVVPTPAPPAVDNVKVQLYMLKKDEGSRGTPLANYFSLNMFSLTWDTIATIKFAGDRTMMMPGEAGE